MASSCMHLCQRCISLLPSRTMGITLKCSTQVQHCSSFLRISSKSPDGASFVPRNLSALNTSQRVKQVICYYSEFNTKPLTTEAMEHRGTDVISGTDAIVPYKKSPNKDAIPTSEYEIMLDIDATARLSALEEISDEEAIGLSPPSTLPSTSTSLRDYVDQSDTLSKLVQLGVNLWKVEQRPNVGSMLLKLDFKTDVVPRLLFLKEIGVEDSRLGYILSHNPFILTESLENLQARVNYLKSKSFSHETVASMVSRAPYLLNFSVKRLDNRLGFYQQQLRLSASKTRDIVARLPRLLCGSLEPVKETLKVCQIELGFKENEIQHIVVAIPKVLTTNKRKLTQIFDYLHNIMKVPHHLIVKFPQVLNSKYLRLRERHLFLQFLGKAQYDPNQPNYIALDRLVSLPDDSFCTEVALATLEDFQLFHKTL